MEISSKAYDEVAARCFEDSGMNQFIFDAPWINYQAAQRLISSVFREIQNYLPSNASYLEFGCGEGNSFRNLAWAMDSGKFSSVTMYDVAPTRLRKIPSRVRERFGRFEITNSLPAGQFELINMSLVASLDTRVISEAANILKENGVLIIFDYDLKGASREMIARLCNTEIEKKLCTADSEGFYRRTVQYGLDDYLVEMQKAGLEIIFQRGIPQKFCLAVGQNTQNDKLD